MVAEARKLLDAAADQTGRAMLPSLVLRLFCGLRTTEAVKLDWSEVRWLEKRPFVHVLAENAKSRRNRLVEIPENALAWLKLCNPPPQGHVAPGNGNVRRYCNQFARLVRRAGFGPQDGTRKTSWENNYTRHSFGSYHCSLYGNPIRTAEQMGHNQNDGVLFSHYRAMVKPGEGEAYFSLRPAGSEGNVTAFPAAASA